MSFFTKHYNNDTNHAFLGASKYHWINYDDDKLARVWAARESARRGTEMHELAHRLIRASVKLPNNNKTMSTYVNDAIGFRMVPEQLLIYSKHAFGTADAISYFEGTLRIHDLKTGVHPASIQQLMVYAALFCLEYQFSPFELRIVLRIYQSDEIIQVEPDPDEIVRIMEKIKHFSALIDRWEEDLNV